MKRREPPQLATWMLEHLSTGERDEALAGDLLEVFRSGRSGNWYWRQAFGACVVSWFNSLRSRASVLVFAFLWSMLAPAWTTVIDRWENTSRVYGHLYLLAWPFSPLAQLGLWLILNIVFLWAGILLYVFLQTGLARTLGRRAILWAFAKAPAILLPAYFTTFVVMNLFAYPGFGIDRRNITPLGEITDLRMWADAMRVPYFITLLVALWSVVPRPRHSYASQLETPIDLPEDDGSVALASKHDPFTLTRFFSLMVAAGLINAMIVGVLVCRLPDTHAPDLASLFVNAAMYVLIGALAGITGSWLYWQSPSSPFRENPPLPFPLFALVCASGWVWVTPMVLLAEQVSPATAFVAMIGAFVLTAGLRHETYPIFASAQSYSPLLSSSDGELFAESTYRAPFEFHGYIIAIGLYGAGAAILSHSNYTAATWLGLSTALFAWKKTIPRSHARSIERGYKRAAVRLALVVVPAIIVTAWAMLSGVEHRNRLAQERAALDAQGRGSADAASKPDSKPSSLGTSGYESLVLWPFPKKKDLLPPIAAPSPLLAPGTKEPLVLRFDGTYNYVQPPDEGPGPNAHRAHGTPLNVDIASSNEWPVMMDAHQDLPGSIPIARCSEIQVQIANGDNRPGIISLGLMLIDGTAGTRHTAYLDQQPIVSTEPGHFFFKASPVSETLRFSVPAGVKLRKFSEITVLVLPDVEHTFVTPKIAIREFRLLPR